VGMESIQFVVRVNHNLTTAATASIRYETVIWFSSVRPLLNNVSFGSYTVILTE